MEGFIFKIRMSLDILYIYRAYVLNDLGLRGHVPISRYPEYDLTLQSAVGWLCGTCPPGNGVSIYAPRGFTCEVCVALN